MHFPNLTQLAGLGVQEAKEEMSFTWEVQMDSFTTTRSTHFKKKNLSYISDYMQMIVLTNVHIVSMIATKLFPIPPPEKWQRSAGSQCWIRGLVGLLGKDASGLGFLFSGGAGAAAFSTQTADRGGGKSWLDPCFEAGFFLAQSERRDPTSAGSRWRQLSSGLVSQREPDSAWAGQGASGRAAGSGAPG